MVILERSIAKHEGFLLPHRINSTIVRLEEQIHARRQEIKGLTATLHMREELHNNGFKDYDTFSVERGTIVNRIRELDREQHSDRKELRPHKRAKETKRKSPFKYAVNTNVPPEFKFCVRIVPSPTKDEGTLTTKKTKPVVLYENTAPKKSNTNEDPLTTRITNIRKQLESLRIQRKNGEISPKEYRRTQQELASELHETERQRGNKPIRTKAQKILTGK